MVARAHARHRIFIASLKSRRLRRRRRRKGREDEEDEEEDDRVRRGGGVASVGREGLNRPNGPSTYDIHTDEIRGTEKYP